MAKAKRAGNSDPPVEPSEVSTTPETDDKPVDKQREARIDPVRPELTAALQKAADAFGEVTEVFEVLESRYPGQNKFMEDCGYYSKQVARVATMLGWYDPEAKKRAKKAALERQLAQLMAELAAEEEASKS